MAYGVFMLTTVNLVLRFVGTWFQVYLSRTIGASGIGLLQLTMSVGSFAMVAGMAGVRTATMYLTAEELGKGRKSTLPWVLSGCMRYSLLCSGAAAILLAAAAPFIAETWIGDSRICSCLRLFAGFLPVSCLCGVLSGFFTAKQRLGTLAAVEVAEQFLSMGVTIAMLTLGDAADPGAACRSVITGSGVGACMSLTMLYALRLRERNTPGDPLPLKTRLISTAVPLALADIVKSGLSTAENLLVPRRLGLHRPTPDPLAAFGMITGMVFPVLMFPACILYALAELLIPELARCAAAGSDTRVRYLVGRGLKLALLYSLVFAGGMFLLSQELTEKLYGSEEAGFWLQQYALMVPMLYCDAIVDAMVKGLGKQKISVRYNILTSFLDISALFVLLPRFGMQGYYWSFLISHGVNFLLSIRLLLRLTHVKISPRMPISCLAAGIGAVWGAGIVGSSFGRLLCYLLLLGSGLTLLGVVTKEDFRWLRSQLLTKGPEKVPASV